MFKQYIHTLVIFVIVAGSTLALGDHSNPEQNMPELLDRIGELLDKVPGEKVKEAMIVKAKLDAIKGISDAMLGQNNTPNTSHKDKKEEAKDLEAHFFEPKEPKRLSQDDKKVDIIQRIGKKYIGNIPQQVENVILYFGNHQECIQNNIEIYNRVLLHGHPGTGKSHLFKAITEELEIHSLSFSASFFADKYIGESSRKIRKAFKAAKDLNKPILIFIDEIDALATKRNKNTHDEHRGTLITLLTELQELQGNKNIFVFAATNDLNALDPAIKDRFAGSVCEIKALTLDERATLFQTVFATKGKIIDADFAKRLAQVTNTTTQDKETEISKPTFSNRDVEYIVTTGLLLRFFECKKDPQGCKEKHLAHYVKKAIDSTGKKGSFSNTFFEKYSDGI